MAAQFLKQLKSYPTPFHVVTGPDDETIKSEVARMPLEEQEKLRPRRRSRPPERFGEFITEDRTARTESGRLYRCILRYH